MKLTKNWAYTSIEGFASLVMFFASLVLYVLAQCIVGFAFIMWRITGGVNRLLEEFNADSLPELHGLKKTHYLTVSRKFIIAKLDPPDFNGKYTVLVRFPDTIYLERAENQEAATPYMTVPGLHIHFFKVFPVPSEKVRHGCHGRYSLAKAAFLKKFLGEDPMCGGGIKHFFPPVIKSAIAYVQLLSLSKERCIKMFVNDMRDGGNFRVSDQKEGPWGYVKFFVGSEADIHSFERQEGIRLRPITVHVA